MAFSALHVEALRMSIDEQCVRGCHCLFNTRAFPLALIGSGATEWFRYLGFLITPWILMPRRPSSQGSLSNGPLRKTSPDNWDRWSPRRNGRRSIRPPIPCGASTSTRKMTSSARPCTRPISSKLGLAMCLILRRRRASTSTSSYANSLPPYRCLHWRTGWRPTNT